MKTKRKRGKLTGALLCGTMLAGLLSMTAFSEESSVAINETNFPDAAFRGIVKAYDIDGDEVLSNSEIEGVTEIVCSSEGISSLKGIEHFTALERLNCCNNRLSSLDVSKNTTLLKLDCCNNRLSSLDVSKNTALLSLDCCDNWLSSLDVSKNTALLSLDCYDNWLSSLDVSQNTVLERLHCSDNWLSSLDVSQNMELEYLYCYDNRYLIEVPEDRVFDLSTLPGFDVSRASNWQGGTVDGNQLHLKDDVVTVTYNYDCGNNHFEIFSLKFIIAEDVAINETNFPDEKFRKFVKSYDIDGDEFLSNCEIEKVTMIYCPERGISSLEGIEHFSALKELWCFENSLTSLDVSRNTELIFLYCYRNQLTSLDVSQNTELSELNCAYNQLTSLDVSQNIALTDLGCYNNQLSELDVSQNIELRTLNCADNQLSSLDVSRNTRLLDLRCDHNQLTSLDVSGNTLLRYFHCYRNQLTSLDVSQNTALVELKCSVNKYLIEVSENRMYDLSTLPGFDVSKASNWQGGTVDGNQLHVNDDVVTVTYNYDCGNNHYETFSLKLMADDVAIDETNFPDDNFRKIVKSYDIDGNNALSGTEIEVVNEINCQKKEISDLKGIEYFTALNYLSCYDNRLSSLDLSKNTGLERLDCYNNQLSSLDVSHNTALEWLDCHNNQLISLDVSGNTSLEWLYCYNNQLTSLDVSRNTVLWSLDCSNNQYTIEVPANRTYDLSTLPGFDVSKARNWQGGTVDGNQLHVNDDVETVTYYYDCGNNKSREFTLVVKILPHPCVFDQKVILEEALKTPADCIHDAVYYMSCACGEISTSEEETFAAEGTALGHDYATAWSSDKTNHWHECSRCQDKKDEAAHNLKTSVTPATMTKAGKEVTKCSICEEVTNTKTIAAIKTVKLSKTSYTYDGKTKTPGLTVKDTAGKTIAGKYYKVVKSSGRKNVGKYTYKITFKGNYKGTKTLSFVINPRGTELISLEAESKGFTARWKKQATQTTGYEIRYAANPKMDKAQTVKITKNSKVSQKVTKLSAKKKYYVQIRTYKKINTATYYSGWSKTRTVTTRK